MKLGWKNKKKSKIHDWHNRTGSALFGGIGGGGGGDNSEKKLKNEVFVTYKWVIRS